MRENLEDLFDGLQNDGLEGRSCTPLGDYALVAETRRITSFAPQKDESSTSQFLLVLPLERTISLFLMMSKRPPTPRPNFAGPGSKRPRDGEVFRRPVAPDTAQGNPDSRPRRSCFKLVLYCSRSLRPSRGRNFRCSGVIGAVTREWAVCGSGEAAGPFHSENCAPDWSTFGCSWTPSFSRNSHNCYDYDMSVCPCDRRLRFGFVLR